MKRRTLLIRFKDIVLVCVLDVESDFLQIKTRMEWNEMRDKGRQASREFSGFRTADGHCANRAMTAVPEAEIHPSPFQSIDRLPQAILLSV